MRPSGTGVPVIVLLSMFITSNVEAQVMCTLGAVFNQSQYNPYLDSAPSTQAAQEVNQIYNVLCYPYGCGTYFLVSNPTIPNAMAAPIGPGQTKIGYQPTFMNSIALQYGGGATLGILAHEFGHHIDFHTTPSWMNTSWSRELKADAWAGCALARLGVSTSQLDNALAAIARFPSASHPGWPQRQQAVSTGFVSCGGYWPF